MSLTALEWLALPDDERERRMWELSPHECFLLRTRYELMPRGPEHYPNGPLKERVLTGEELEKRRRSEYTILQEWDFIPEDMTFEEWVESGCNWNLNSNKHKSKRKK